MPSTPSALLDWNPSDHWPFVNNRCPVTIPSLTTLSPLFYRCCFVFVLRSFACQFLHFCSLSRTQTSAILNRFSSKRATFFSVGSICYQEIPNSGTPSFFLFSYLFAFSFLVWNQSRLNNSYGNDPRNLILQCRSALVYITKIVSGIMFNKNVQ